MSKRCTFCGRQGSRMKPIHSPWGRRLDGYKCASPIACIRRQEQRGQWLGKRVLHRIDHDGTEWKIYRSAAGTWCLRMTYRDHSMLTTGLLTIEAAKNHAEDMLASLAARSLREYESAEIAAHNTPHPQDVDLFGDAS